MQDPSPARVVATRVLHRIATEGAWSTPALDAEIDRARASVRDAALATEIVFGTLRSLPSLDRAIEARLTRKGALEPVVLAALRAAAYQLAHLRTPPHAAVSDAVSIVRVQRGEGLARFTNAVLRGLARERPEAPERALGLEVPPWMHATLEEGLGAERAARFLASRTLPPPLSLRVGRGIDRHDLAARIRSARPEGTVREGTLSPYALVVGRVGDPRMLPGYHEAEFAVQDEGSQAVALALEAQPGERIADACSGRGGKTGLLLGEVGAEGHVTALDLHERKLEQIVPELSRLGLPAHRVDTLPLDLSVGTGGLDGRFDRVLVDAPCTGIGTIHRRPELLLRLTPADPARMADLQLTIARHAARMVKPGGMLVFAVCSPTRAEGPEVAARLEAEMPGLVRVREAPASLDLVVDVDGVLRIGPFGGPDESEPDAYQVVRFRVG
jgi:16S rRNA (cytosine967-C5)-methyltransferase